MAIVWSRSTGKTGLDPIHLLPDGVPHNQARLRVRESVELNVVALLAHAGNYLRCHRRWHSGIPVVTDHEKRSIGRLLAEFVAGKEIFDELIAFPTCAEAFRW